MAGGGIGFFVVETLRKGAFTQYAAALWAIAMVIIIVDFLSERWRARILSEEAQINAAPPRSFFRSPRHWLFLLLFALPAPAVRADQVEEAWEQINAVDDALEEQLDFAFHPQYGYLTACPTNVGTGIRVSVMLHLPALRLTNELEKVGQAARDMKLAVRGLHGEGTEAVGDFFQVSNQITLGRGEAEIIDDFRTVVIPKIVEYEYAAREALLRSRPQALDDKIWRALNRYLHWVVDKEVAVRAVVDQLPVERVQGLP